MSLLYNRITGKNVVANGFPTLGHIKLDRGCTARPVFASNTQGGADRASGNLYIRGYYYAWGGYPPAGVFPGETFALTFTINGTEVASATAVMCTGLEVFAPTYDPSQRNRCYYVVHFGPAGYDLVLTGAVPTDTASPMFYNVKGLAATLDTVAQDGTQDMHLQIRNLAQESIDSSYNGIWYVPAGNIDWTFRYKRAIASLASLPAVNSIVTAGMEIQNSSGTTPALAWALAYGRVITSEGTYDRADEKTMTSEVVIEKCENGTDVGSIIDPLGVTQWP